MGDFQTKCVGIILFLTMTMSVLVLAFTSRFWDRFFTEFAEAFLESGGYRLRPIITIEYLATSFKNYQEDYRPTMIGALQSTIAFSAIASFLSILGIIVGFKGSNGKKATTGVLLILVLIGLLISVATWADQDRDQLKMSPYTSGTRFHQAMIDQMGVLKDNNIDFPAFIVTWRNAYYGSIVCMVLAVFFGLLGSYLLILPKILNYRVAKKNKELQQNNDLRANNAQPIFLEGTSKPKIMPTSNAHETPFRNALDGEASEDQQGKEFSSLCKICMVSKIETIFEGCGHGCCCFACASNLKTKECPICRKISKVKRIFLN